MTGGAKTLIQAVLEVEGVRRLTHLAQDREVLLARLERLPLNKGVLGIIGLLSLVWVAEAFDIGMVGSVLTTVSNFMHLSHNQVGLLGAGSTAGVVLGMVPSGYLADRWGRRRVVIWGIVWFSVFTLTGAIAGGFGSLLTVRVLAGFGEGAVLPLPYLYLAEFVGTRYRALSVGGSNGILTSAYLLPNLAAVWALQSFSGGWAWRTPFLLGGLPLLLVLPLARYLPESPRFLLRQERFAEVENLVKSLERGAGLPKVTSFSHLRESSRRESSRKEQAALLSERIRANEKAITHHDWANFSVVQRISLARLVRAPYGLRTLVVAMQLTGTLMLFYVLQVFGPTLLLSKGLSNGSAILYTGFMMAVAGVGSVMTGYLSDRIGRKWVLGGSLSLASLGCLFMATGQQSGTLLLAGGLASFFGLGVLPVAKLSVAEQYPTALRGRGVYVNEMSARLVGGVFSLYFVPLLLQGVGSRGLFAGMAATVILLSVPYLLWGRETYNVTMEQSGSIQPLRNTRRETATSRG